MIVMAVLAAHLAMIECAMGHILPRFGAALVYAARLLYPAALPIAWGLIAGLQVYMSWLRQKEKSGRMETKSAAVCLLLILLFWMKAVLEAPMHSRLGNPADFFLYILRYVGGAPLAWSFAYILAGHFSLCELAENEKVRRILVWVGLAAMLAGDWLYGWLFGILPW